MSSLETLVCASLPDHPQGICSVGGWRWRVGPNLKEMRTFTPTYSQSSLTESDGSDGKTSTRNLGDLDSIPSFRMD